MRRIFSFRVLAIAVAAPIISARGAFPERLLSPELETDCVSGEHRGALQGLERARLTTSNHPHNGSARQVRRRRSSFGAFRGVGHRPATLRRGRRLNTVKFVGRVRRLNTAVLAQQHYGVSLGLNTVVLTQQRYVSAIRAQYHSFCARMDQAQYRKLYAGISSSLLWVDPGLNTSVFVQQRSVGWIDSEYDARWNLAHSREGRSHRNDKMAACAIV